MKKTVLFLTLTGLISTSAIAAPFGLRAGISLDEVKSMTELKLVGLSRYGEYSASSLPKGHPDFNGYQLKFSENYGLCEIVAIKELRDAPSEDFTNSYDRIAGNLSNKYGTTEDKFNYMATTDFSKPVPLVTTKWEGAFDDVASIEFTGYAISLKDFDFELHYRFNNTAACDEDISREIMSLL